MEDGLGPCADHLGEDNQMGRVARVAMCHSDTIATSNYKTGDPKKNSQFGNAMLTKVLDGNIQDEETEVVKPRTEESFSSEEES